MRKFKRIFSFVIVLTLLVSISTGAFAASYTASSYEELKTAFADASGEDVDIDLTANVMIIDYLTAKDGIKYTIGTENDSILYGAKFNGNGEVEVNADITSVDGLYTKGDVTVTVNGDISTTYIANGVCAEDNSTVTVNGDISAGCDGVHARGNSTVTVNGDVSGAWNGVDAEDYSNVTVNGNVAAKDADPSKVDLTDPRDYEDACTGIYAAGNSTVSVTGNVTGGKAYGNRGEGGEGIAAEDSASVTVGGNVSGGDVSTGKLNVAIYYSGGGDGICMDSGATVTVGGNVLGGSSDGLNGEGGHGVKIIAKDGVDEGCLYIGGSVSNGTGGSGIDGAGLKISEYNGGKIIPEMFFGALDDVKIDGSEKLSEEEIQRVLDKIHIMGLKSVDVEDLFWLNVYMEICRAEKGDTVTVDAAHRTTVPAYVLRAAYEHEVTLVIEWDGGETITVSGYDCGENSTLIVLSDLSELILK